MRASSSTPPSWTRNTSSEHLSSSLLTLLLGCGNCLTSVDPSRLMVASARAQSTQQAEAVQCKDLNTLPIGRVTLVWWTSLIKVAFEMKRASMQVSCRMTSHHHPGPQQVPHSISLSLATTGSHEASVWLVPPVHRATVDRMVLCPCAESRAGISQDESKDPNPLLPLGCNLGRFSLHRRANGQPKDLLQRDLRPLKVEAGHVMQDSMAGLGWSGQ
jgi:hypothetical protein